MSLTSTQVIGIPQACSFLEDSIPISLLREIGEGYIGLNKLLSLLLVCCGILINISLFIPFMHLVIDRAVLFCCKIVYNRRVAAVRIDGNDFIQIAQLVIAGGICKAVRCQVEAAKTQGMLPAASEGTIPESVDHFSLVLTASRILS